MSVVTNWGSAPRIQCAELAHGRLGQLRQYFPIKINFSNVFPFFFGGRRSGWRTGPGGVWGSSSKKAPLVSFVSVWENRIRNRLAAVPVCDDGHFLRRKVSFGSGGLPVNGGSPDRGAYWGGYEMGISRANAARNPSKSLRNPSKSTVGLLKLRLQCVIGLHIVRITHCKAIYKKPNTFFLLGWGEPG